MKNNNSLSIKMHDFPMIASLHILDEAKKFIDIYENERRDFMYEIMEYNFIEAAEYLSQLNFDFSCNNNWAIKYAAEKGLIEMTEIILRDPRVDPSDDNNEALYFALTNNFPEIGELLLKDQRMDLSKSGSEDFFEIAWYSDFQDVIDLLFNNPKFNLDYVMYDAAQNDETDSCSSESFEL